MTVLTVIQQACAESLGLAVPSAFFASTRREHVELQSIVNAAAKYIASDYNWQTLSRIATITGDGSTEDFDLPADYSHMPVEANLYSSRLRAPLTKAKSRDEWLDLQTQNVTPLYAQWIIYGDQVHFLPAPASAETVQYFYQSDLIVIDSNSATKTAFTLDSDSFRLNEPLLKLATVFHWRSAKGLRYAEELATYEREKEKLITRDGGARILRVGAPRMPMSVDIAYPQSVGP